jgi:hypothetical protein
MSYERIPDIWRMLNGPAGELRYLRVLGSSLREMITDFMQDAANDDSPVPSPSRGGKASGAAIDDGSVPEITRMVHGFAAKLRELLQRPVLDCPVYVQAHIFELVRGLFTESAQRQTAIVVLNEDAAEALVRIGNYLTVLEAELAVKLHSMMPDMEHIIQWQKKKASARENWALVGRAARITKWLAKPSTQIRAMPRMALDPSVNYPAPKNTPAAETVGKQSRVLAWGTGATTFA